MKNDPFVRKQPDKIVPCRDEPPVGRFLGLYLGEATAVLGHDEGVGTLQLLDDLKALVELREDVDHGAGEESVLGRLLELRPSRVVTRENTHNY